MIEPKFLTFPDYPSKSMQYEFLRQLGVEWIQRISGKKWTDYNYHDPGITFWNNSVMLLPIWDIEPIFPFKTSC